MYSSVRVFEASFFVRDFPRADDMSRRAEDGCARARECERVVVGRVCVLVRLARLGKNKTRFFFVDDEDRYFWFLALCICF